MAPKKVQKQLETPQKSKVRGAARFCEQKGIKYTKKDLAQAFKISRYEVDTALGSAVSRTSKSSDLKARNAEKLTERDLDHIELFIKNNQFEGHKPTWSELVEQFSLSVHWRTLQRRMANRLVFTFVAITRPFLDEKLAKHRVQWATDMLAKYPTPEDWRHVRFSNEVHYG